MVRTSSVLAVPGRPVIRQWPPTNRRDHHLFDHLFLADDDAADLPDDLGIDFAEARNPGLQNVRFKLWGDGSGHESVYLFAFAAQLRAAASGPA